MLVGRGIATDRPGLGNQLCCQRQALGLLIETSGPQDEVLKLLPALTITADELDERLRTLARAVRQTAQGETNT